MLFSKNEKTIIKFQLKIRCNIDDFWEMFVPSVNLFCIFAIVSTFKKNIAHGPEMLNYRQLKDSLESKFVLDVRAKLYPFFL